MQLAGDAPVLLHRPTRSLGYREGVDAHPSIAGDFTPLAIIKDVWSDLNPADSIRQIRPDQTSGRRLKSDLKKHIRP